MNFSYFPLRKESASTIFQRTTRGEEPKIFRTISKRIFQFPSTPWILPSKYQKIYKDVLLDGGLCHTEGSIERFAAFLKFHRGGTGGVGDARLEFRVRLRNTASGRIGRNRLVKVKKRKEKKKDVASRRKWQR